MYTYADLTDKTKEGIEVEASRGLAVMGFHMATVHGFPFEIFREILDDQFPTSADRLWLYMTFRNKHPELYGQEA